VQSVFIIADRTMVVRLPLKLQYNCLNTHLIIGTRKKIRSFIFVALELLDNLSIGVRMPTTLAHAAKSEPQHAIYSGHVGDGHDSESVARLPKLWRESFTIVFWMSDGMHCESEYRRAAKSTRLF